MIAAVAWASGGLPVRFFRDYRRVALVGCALLGIVFSWLSFERSGEWHDDVSLWSPVASAVPDDPRVLTNLASGYLRAGDRASAKKVLLRALAVAPDHLSALNNMAFIELEAGRRQEARKLYREVVALDPDNHLAWNNLGVLETQEMNHSAARDFYAKAIEVNPNYATAHRNLRGAEDAVARALSFIATHSQLNPDSTPSDLLRDYALACFVSGSDACVAGTEAALLRR
jgi:tetratricopeptide (TPR) repeat protein